jgi:hypothetical protein
MIQARHSDIGTLYDVQFAYHVVIGWQNVREPGFYVSTRTGHGFRVSSDLLHGDNGPSMQVLEAEGNRFVRVSGDPHVSSMAAKLLCVDRDIVPHF